MFVYECLSTYTFILLLINLALPCLKEMRLTTAFMLLAIAGVMHSSRALVGLPKGSFTVGAYGVSEGSMGLGRASTGQHRGLGYAGKTCRAVGARGFLRRYWDEIGDDDDKGWMVLDVTIATVYSIIMEL